MALGSVLGSLAIGAGTSLASKFLGGGDSGSTRVQIPQISTASPTLRAGGLTATASGNNVRVKASDRRKGLVGNVARAFGQQAGLFEQLRGRVAPGVSDLRASRLANVEDARSRAVGNLRENLQRRRVLGSSFGRDALTRAEAEFGRERDRVESETFLQELELTNNFINQEFQARTQSFQTRLNEMNLQADLATGIQSRITSDLNQNARLQASLALQGGQANAKSAQQSAAGAGQFFGQLASPIATGTGNAFSNQSNLSQIGSQFANSTQVVS